MDSISFDYFDAIDFLHLADTRYDVQDLIQSCYRWATLNHLNKPNFEHRSNVFAIRINGLYTGFAQIYGYEEYKELYLAWVYILPEYRRFKQGTKLLELIQAFTHEHKNYDTVSCYVLNNNFASQALHTKCGFVLGKPKCFELEEKMKPRFLGMIWEDQWDI